MRIRKTEVYHIDGMSCAACSSAVERVTRKLNGVESSSVNLTTNKMTITYDEALVTPDMIINKVEKAGFGARPFVEEKNLKEQEEAAWDCLLYTSYWFYRNTNSGNCKSPKRYREHSAGSWEQY